MLGFEREGLVTNTFRRLDRDRRAAILDAVIDEATERDPTGIRVKQIAAAAGVSVGSLYQYFGNRQGLLAFAVALCGSLLLEQFASYRSALISLPLAEGLAAYVAGGVEWSRTEAGLLRSFARGAYDGDPALGERLVTPLATAMVETVRDMLQAAQDRGEARRDIDLEATARVVNALAISVGDSQLLPHINRYMRLGDEEVSFERSAAAMLELVVAGLRP